MAEINPSIPLSVQLPAQPAPYNPMATIATLMNMRNQASEIAVRQAQAEHVRQQAESEAQQRAADLKDSNTLQEALNDPAMGPAIMGGDTSSIQGRIRPGTLLKFKDGLEKLTATHLANTKAQNLIASEDAGEISKTLSGLWEMAKTDPASAAAASGPAIQNLVDQNRFRAFPKVQIPAGLSGDPKEIERLLAQVGGVKALYDSALARQKEEGGIAKDAAATAASASQAELHTTENTIKQSQLSHMTDTGLLPEQQVQAQHAAAQLAHQQSVDTETQRYHRAEERLAGGRLAVEQKRLAQTTGGVELNPAQQSIAQKLASGEMNPTLLSRFPDKEALISGAIAINPNWTNQTYATRRAFEDPQAKQSQNLGTISRIVGHIDRFEKNSKALGLAPAYALGVNVTGQQNALNNDAHAISAELEKLVSGGVGTEGQVQGWMRGLHSPSASARQQSVDEISQLIGSQYEGMNQTFKTGTGSDLPVEKFVSPAGQAWLKAKGINTGGAAAAGAGPKAKRPPATGTIEDGYRFKGGDPANQASWEKVQ